MSIRKQLYLSFGVILAMVLVLLAVNMTAVWREHETKAAAQRSIDMTEAISTVRFQMMQNRLHLQNYLLSGDTRDVEKMTDGERLLNGNLRHAQELVNGDQQRNGLQKVQDLEQSWASDFANPWSTGAAPSTAAMRQSPNCKSSISKRIPVRLSPVLPTCSTKSTAKTTNYWINGIPTTSGQRPRPS